MYKDKAKQKQANKAAAQRRRDKSKGMTNQGMTADIEQGMTQARTRPLIPGDADYIGVCTEVDGKWSVTGKHKPIEQPKDLDYSTLPPGVVKPWSEQPWSCTPEYQQLINNPMTMAIDQLKSIGQSIPVWKAVA